MSERRHTYKVIISTSLFRKHYRTGYSKSTESHPPLHQGPIRNALLPNKRPKIPPHRHYVPPPQSDKRDPSTSPKKRKERDSHLKQDPKQTL